MGLIQAVKGTIGSTLADQWKEYFVCDSLPDSVLMRKGVKRNKKNNNGSDNTISDGSTIVVNEGQCAIVVDNGLVTEITTEPGLYTFNTSSPSIFISKEFGENIKKVFNEAVGRFTYGGNVSKDQRVYFINTRKLVNTPYGTNNPVPYKVIDRDINGNLRGDVTLQIRCHGYYNLHVKNPIALYKLAGNISTDYTIDRILDKLRSEFSDCLVPALQILGKDGVHPNEINTYSAKLKQAINTAVVDIYKWEDNYGLEISNITVEPITLTDDDQEKLERLGEYGDSRSAAMMRDFKDMAKSGGTIGMMMGMGLGQQMNNMMGGVMQCPQYPNNQNQSQQSQKIKCPKCGAMNQVGTKFCGECGSKLVADTWKCSKCGTENTGKYCLNCGEKKPE